MLPVNSEIFKVYDIRGIYGQDFDNELAYLLGLAYVELRKNDPDYEAGKKLRIAVGMDMRLSSPSLKDNLLRGLVSAGADAIDFGLVSTPTFYFGVGRYGYEGGIMISASHNPKEWNGFKLVRKKGEPISGETGIAFLKHKILENHLLPSPTPGNILTKDNVHSDEMECILNKSDIASIKPLKVVLDTANGMGGAYLPQLLAKTGIRVIPLNLKLDGTFPAHEADPLKPENLTQLQESVRFNKADLGIATDGDGDRIFFVDNLGRTIDPALLRGLLASLFLKEKPGAKIGYDVRPGKITVDFILENGGLPIVTRVGHSLIKEQMIKENIYFAGESSGHFYLQEETGCFEYPGLMVLKLLSAFSECGQDAASYVDKFKKYFSSGEINRKVKDKEEVFSRILKRYANEKITRIDGITIETNDFWFNVRGSNTEEVIRLNLESRDEQVMIEKRDEVLGLIS